MLLVIYNFLFTLLIPIIILNLLRKSKKNPDYKHNISERLAFRLPDIKDALWIHSVSVGESIAISPLVKKIANNYPDISILVTMMTPTGRVEVKKLYQHYPNIYHCYLPYDSSIIISRFIRIIKPKCLVLMETEIWPILINTCYKRKVPVILTNARLSNKSKKNYQKISFLIKKILNEIDYIACQSEHDLDNFIAIGAKPEKISITGNLKFDIQISSVEKALGIYLKSLLQYKRIWIAASTHKGEDDIILKAHKKVLKHIDDCLLIIVPRHPERFDEVYEQSLSLNFTTTKRTLLNNKTLNQYEVLIGNSMGEMMSYYYTSDIAFIGGSLINKGGHNLLEPASLGIPTLTGPSLFNFKNISDLLIMKNATKVIDNDESLAKEILRLYSNESEYNHMAKMALETLNQNKGSISKQRYIIEKYI